MTCESCRVEQHTGCNGDTWDDNGPTVCACWMRGHQEDGRPFARSDRYIRQPGDRYDPEGEEADRVADRQQTVNERRMP